MQSADWPEKHLWDKSQVRTTDDDDSAASKSSTVATDCSQNNFFLGRWEILFGLPGLGTVQRRRDQVPPAVPVEDQRLAAGQDAAAEADLSAAQRQEAVVGGEARTGETLGEERREGLRGQLAGRTAEAWVAPARRGKSGARGGGTEREREREKKVKGVKRRKRRQR